MPAFFVPARNSRHRTACFALYKALLRQGARVPLPDDVATHSGPVNPIKHLVRKGFRRNKNDTSPRLVVCALQTGYKFLDLLTAAQTPSTTQHASILSFLRTRLAARQAAATRHHKPVTAPSDGPPARNPKPTSALHPDRVPLLTRVSPATRQSPPVYASTQRPLALARLSGGVRRLPTLDECNGVPFLRLRRPQPPGLSRVLRQKAMKRQARTTKVIRLMEVDAREAKWEDGWERSVGGLLGGGGEGEVDKKGGRGDREGTFGESVQRSVTYVSGALDAERVDMIARGKAMWKIVEAERALAKEERRQLREAKRRAKEAQAEGSEDV